MSYIHQTEKHRSSLPPFDGTTDFTSWKKFVNIVGAGLDWSSNKKMAHMLLALEGDLGVHIRQSSKTDWTEASLTTAIETFCQEQLDFLTSLGLHGLYQRDNETVQSFFIRVKSAAERVKPTYQTFEHEQSRVFLNGLKPLIMEKLKPLMNESRIKMEDLYKLSCKLELTATPETRVDDLTDRVKSLRIYNARTKEQSASADFKPYCYHCKQHGHMTGNCPTNEGKAKGKKPNKFHKNVKNVRNVAVEEHDVAPVNKVDVCDALAVEKRAFAEMDEVDVPAKKIPVVKLHLNESLEASRDEKVVPQTQGPIMTKPVIEVPVIKKEKKSPLTESTTQSIQAIPVTLTLGELLKLSPEIPKLLSQSQCVTRHVDSTPKLMGLVKQTQARVIPDGGAALNIFSKSFLERLDITISPPPEVILRLADGSVVPLLGSVENVPVTFANCTLPVSGVVIDVRDYDILIGVPWLKANKAMTNWLDNTFTIEHLGKRIPLESPPIPCDYAQLYKVELIVPSEEPQTQNEVSPILKDLFCKFPKIFDDIDSARPVTNVLHTIDTGDNTPITEKPYRTPIHYEDILSKKIKEMVEGGIIFPSKSAWAAPVLCVPKPNGDVRVVIDYRKINSITKKDKYPLPLIDDALRSFKDSTYFSTLDCNAGYWQIPMAEQDKEKTTFVTSSGTYSFNVMPFGLTNAPATFQRTMNTILEPFINKFAFVYLDDILVFSKTKEEHIKHLEIIFDALEKHNFKLNHKKCKFLEREVNFLGFHISQEGISTQVQKIKAINRISVPASKEELRRFLGMVSFYRRFIKDFTKLALPLLSLLKKDVPYNWTNTHTDSFKALKQALDSSPVLMVPDTSSQFILHTDACKDAFGAVLSQERGGEIRPIAFISRKTSPSEKNWSTTDLECGAVLYAFAQFRHYLLGKRFKLYTDHSAILHLLQKKDTSAKYLRWSLKLADFDFECSHIKGTENVVADALSRLPTNAVNIDEYNELSQIEAYLRTGFVNSPNKQKVIRKSNKFCLVDNYLHRINSSRLPTRVIKAQEEQNQIIDHYHNLGHFGVKSIYQSIIPTYWWPNMFATIAKRISSCEVCIKFKIPKAKFEFIKVLRDTRIFGKIALDFVGPLPVTESGNRYIIVAVDYHSRWPWAMPSPDCTTKTVTKFLLDIIANTGVPDVILTDQGTHFTSELMQQFTSIFGFKHVKTAPYYPRSNGLVERFNQTLVRSLAKLSIANQNDWDTQIPLTLLSYRCRPRKDLNDQSPFELIHGISPQLSAETPLEAFSSCDDHFKIGTKVMLYRPLIARMSKLDPPNLGPFTVVKFLGPRSVLLNDPKSDKTYHAHLNQLIPYVSA